MTHTTWLPKVGDRMIMGMVIHVDSHISGRYSFNGTVLHVIQSTQYENFVITKIEYGGRTFRVGCRVIGVTGAYDWFVPTDDEPYRMGAEICSVELLPATTEGDNQ